MSFAEDDARLAELHGYEPVISGALLAVLTRLATTIERVDARLETLERNLKARGRP